MRAGRDGLLRRRVTDRDSRDQGSWLVSYGTAGDLAERGRSTRDSKRSGDDATDDAGNTCFGGDKSYVSDDPASSYSCVLVSASRRENSSTNPTNQEVISKSQGTPIHRFYQHLSPHMTISAKQRLNTRQRSTKLQHAALRSAQPTFKTMR